MMAANTQQQHSPAPQATTPAALPTGSIASSSISLYITLAAQESKSAETLYAMFVKSCKRDKPLDVLHNGYWALKCRLEDRVEALRDCGGLLFFGSAAALDAARVVRAAQ